MGLKTLILITLLIIGGLFFLQNLQPISLVFFGFNIPTLPLSVWVLIAFCGGIIISIIIHSLNSNYVEIKGESPRMTTPSSPRQPPPPNSTNYEEKSTGVKYNPSSSQSYQTSSPYVSTVNESQKTVNTSSTENNLFEEDLLGEKDEFDFLEEETPEIIPSSQEITESQDNQDNQDTDKIPELRENHEKLKLSEESDSVKPLEEKLSEREVELPSQAWLKTREASFYSYQPKEKTDIRNYSSSPPLTNDSQKQSPSKSLPRNPNEIYDAPFRVILPSPSEDVYPEDENEDWDF